MDDVQQFAHDGDNDDLVGLATGLEFAHPAAKIRIVAHHGEGTHVEPLADLGVADFGDGGPSMHGGSRGLLSRTEASVGDQLGSVAEAVLIEEGRVQTHGGQLRDARDAIEVGTGLSELAGLCHQVAGTLQGALALGVQPADMLKQRLAGAGIQAQVLQAIALLLSHVLQIVDMS